MKYVTIKILKKLSLDVVHIKSKPMFIQNKIIEPSLTLSSMPLLTQLAIMPASTAVPSGKLALV
jgi:hypothetical protein